MRVFGRSIRVFEPGDWFVSNYGRGASSIKPPVNTVAPNVTGIPSSSNVLTCDTGTWTGEITGLSFQWFKDDLIMPGENSSQLTVVSPYIGSVVKCAVIASNASGQTPAFSNEVTIIP